MADASPEPGLAYQLFEKQMTVHTLVHYDPQAHIKRVGKAQPANNIADLMVDLRINLGDIVLMRRSVVERIIVSVGWKHAAKKTKKKRLSAIMPMGGALSVHQLVPNIYKPYLQEDPDNCRRQKHHEGAEGGFARRQRGTCPLQTQ